METFRALIKAGFANVPGLRKTVTLIRQTDVPGYNTTTGDISRSEEEISVSAIFVRSKEREVAGETVLATDRICNVAAIDLPAGKYPTVDWRIRDSVGEREWEVFHVHPIPAVANADVALWRLFVRQT